MANLEWEAAHDLVTPGGTVFFNQVVDGDRLFRLTPDYKMVPSLRITQDNISQADGSVLHPRWKTGMTCVMQIEYDISLGETEYTPACGKDLREMNEQLSAALNSIRRFAGAEQRLIWTPSNDGDSISRRILDDIQTLAWLDPSYLEPGSQVSFSVETPFPYAIDLNQTETDVDKILLPAKCHPVDELACLPDDPRDVHLQRLVSQLSWVKWYRRENGKIIMESKEQMSKRGLPSPDYADAYVLTETGMGKAEKLAAFAKVNV